MSTKTTAGKASRIRHSDEYGRVDEWSKLLCKPIDFDAKTFFIPIENSKNEKVHNIYLSDFTTCQLHGSLSNLRFDHWGVSDYPRRLVGRCDESPRERIFSFDRVTRRGVTLRGSELK